MDRDAVSDLPSVDLTTIDFFPTGPLAEDEEYLWSILSDRSGIDIAEFTFVDEEKLDRCFRTRAYQHTWFRDNSRFQIEQNARDVGKALCLTTPIFTANRGWATMGTIEVGDVVFDETGAQCNVTKVFAELIGRDCYEVRFDDNSTLVCDGEHEFETLSATWGRRVLTVREIALSLTYGQNAPLHKPDLYKKWNHRIEVASPLDYGREAGVAEVRSATPARALGFCWWQRVEVLQRHMDKYGDSLALGRRVRVKASAGLRALLRSLGVKFAESDGTLSWSPSGGLNPFIGRADEARPVDAVDSRYIIGVERVKSRPVRCITVDSPSHLYLAGDDFVATHNSLSILLRAVAWPFGFPGQDMLITAPRGVHLKPITERVEHHFFRSGSRLLEETLISKKNGTRQGISKMPAWSLQFANNARIVTRLPNIDGSGVKGSVEGSALINTIAGLKRADEIVEGDLVLTEFGRYKPVVRVLTYVVSDAVRVGGRGLSSIIVGGNHRFLARRNLTPDKARTLSMEQEWVPVFDDDLTRVFYWAMPSRFPALELPSPPEGARTAQDVSEAMNAAGRWAAGSLHGCPRDQLAWVRANVSQHTVDPWVLGAPFEARASFFDGFLGVRGGWNPLRSRFQVRGADRRELVALAQLARTLGFGASVLTDQNGGSTAQFMTKPGAFVSTDAHDYGRITSAERVDGEVRLYDFGVEEDFSYVADGVVHLGGAL